MLEGILMVISVCNANAVQLRIHASGHIEIMRMRHVEVDN
jgi:hypothetical protein